MTPEGLRNSPTNGGALLGKGAPEARPDPDRLLGRLKDAEAKQGRARLKIWFGMAPGVGKTYAMLEAAHRAKQAGVDVVIGWVETHGRGDTEALVQGLEKLPPRLVEHRGTVLREFDLQAAIARRPAVLLLDELAHTNARGGDPSTHQKRWQDLLDLLDAGIDVHTSLNVQHVDSLQDVIREVTGVTVRETVPDLILDRADEIELIDLPPDDLLARLDAGKVYRDEQARQARLNFFQRGNLLALRELALRRTADRVDADVQAWREEHSITDAWGSAERLLICVGPSPGSSEVIRNARRLADRLRASWVAVHVEATNRAPLSDESRERVDVNMRLAESLGGETAWISGENTADAIVAYARKHHFTRIVVGKHLGLSRPIARMRALLGESLVESLVRRSGDIEVHVVACSGPNETPALAPQTRSSFSHYAQAVGLVAAVSATAMGLGDSLATPDVVMLYLMCIMAVAVRFGRTPAIAAAALSVGAFDFFFIEPFYTFHVADTRHLLTFATMFAFGILISTLTDRLRRQEIAAREREARTAALFKLSRELSDANQMADIAAVAAREAAVVFEVEAAIFGSDPAGRAPLAHLGRMPLTDADLAVVRWALEHERPAGIGSEALPGSRVACMPLGHKSGVLVLKPADPTSHAGMALRATVQRHFIEAFARQIGLALGRAGLSDAVRSASMRVEAESIRSALLSSVSHDLRTPLATITGAATTLRDSYDRLAAPVRTELVGAICEEAIRLERLVANLLDMTRLEAGQVQPRREWVPTDELVGAVLVRYERELDDRAVMTTIAPEAASVFVDPVLFGQLLGNLVENAIKYDARGASLEIDARVEGQAVAIAVSDRGPGFRPGEEVRAFERFYRGADATHVTGAGLGLAICLAIARVHGGTMRIANREEGGATVTVMLPLEETKGPEVEGLEKDQGRP